MESKKKLNILILSWRGPGHPNAGGAEISTHEHAKGWVKAGHSVTLFTSYYKGAKREEKINGVNLIRRGRQLLGVQWEVFKWYNFTPHPKFDLVVDQFHGIPFFTPLYIKTKKLALIHEVTKEVWGLNQLPLPFNFFVGIIGRLLEPQIFKLYKNIPFMTVSESTKKDLMRWGVMEDKITVINNGVSVPSKIKKYPKEEKQTLIYLGAISRDKGIGDVLKTFCSIAKADDNWQLWIVGKSDSRYLIRLKSLSKNMGISQKIRFWGFVDEKKKFELLSRAHLAINPSIREGWGLVNIEANSVGLPALVYDVPGSRDSIRNGKNGFLSPLGDYSDLATKALMIMGNRNLYHSMEIQAIIWSKKFSWKKAAKESLKLVEDLVER